MQSYRNTSVGRSDGFCCHPIANISFTQQDREKTKCAETLTFKGESLITHCSMRHKYPRQSEFAVSGLPTKSQVITTHCQTNARVPRNLQRECKAQRVTGAPINVVQNALHTLNAVAGILRSYVYTRPRVPTRRSHYGYQEDVEEKSFDS